MGEQLGFFKTGLTSDKYFSYVELIQREVEQYFTENWGDAGEKDLFGALSEVFTLTSARCLLGPEIREQWSGEYSKMYLDLDHSFIPITFFFPNLPNPMRSKCVKARSTFEKIFKKIVEKRREKEEQHDDFLQVLMDIKYKDGTMLNSAEITGIMMGTLLGGQHTSNVTGTWAMCHLLTNESWRSQVMAEQTKLLDGDFSRDLEYADVEQMEVFDMVLNETLRLHPPFFMLARVAMETTQFNGYTIPKGDFVAVSPGACQRMPEMWGDDAEMFDPSRWTPEAKESHKQYVAALHLTFFYCPFLCCVLDLESFLSRTWPSASRKRETKLLVNNPSTFQGDGNVKI
jgi:sterol 14-demethylase